MASDLYAGVGRHSIRPPLTHPQGGWGAQTHTLADGYHLDLNVTVLILKQGGMGTALVEFDLVGLYSAAEPVRQAVSRATGIPPQRVRCTATHNHAGPVVSENWFGERPDRVAAYKAWLPEQAAGAARMAQRSLQPVRMAAGHGRCTIACSRRQRLADGRMVTGRTGGGPIDPDVFVLRIDAHPSGRPLACILGYTCHPTVLGPGNRLHSPDYPGVARRTLEQATGTTCLFLQGATGNVGPEIGFVADVAVAERLGTILGLEGAKVFHEIRTQPVQAVFGRVWESGAPLGVWREDPLPLPAARLQVATRTVRLPLRPQPPVEEARAEHARLKAVLADLRARSAPDADVEAATFKVRRAQIRLNYAQLHGGRQEAEVELHLLAYGDIAIATTQGEPFVEIGLAIKKESPFPHTWFGGYTGVALGYIPWPDAYPEGGYEVETSPYTPEAAPRLVEAMLQELKAMHKEANP